MDDRHDESQVLSILKTVVENTNEAFVTIDENHRVIFFNRAAERIFGYSRSEVVGRDLDVIMSSTCSRDHHAAVSRYVRTRVPRLIGHQTEMVAARKSGDTFPADISFSVSEISGRLYFTGIVRDLTETKALQEKIARSERLAALGQVVAEITHEIRNPLMLIGGFVHQLIRMTKDEKRLTKLNIVVEEVSRLENLLKELRDFYLPRPLKPEEIDIHNLLQEVYALVKGDCERKQIRTEFIADKGPAIIKGDKSKLVQVFLNLLKNSIEAVDVSGNLSIRTKLTGSEVEIILNDDGCGIPKRNQDKIFDPFFTTKKQGSGLGLSISKSIIEDHEGCSFTVLSEEGKGTTFTITMPIHRPAMKDKTAK